MVLWDAGGHLQAWQSPSSAREGPSVCPSASPCQEHCLCPAHLCHPCQAHRGRLTESPGKTRGAAPSQPAAGPTCPEFRDLGSGRGGPWRPWAHAVCPLTLQLCTATKLRGLVPLSRLPHPPGTGKDQGLGQGSRPAPPSFLLPCPCSAPATSRLGPQGRCRAPLLAGGSPGAGRLNDQVTQTAGPGFTPRQGLPMALCSLSAGTLLGVAGTLALPWGSKLNKEENAERPARPFLLLRWGLPHPTSPRGLCPHKSCLLPRPRLPARPSWQGEVLFRHVLLLTGLPAQGFPGQTSPQPLVQCR